jgi:hypothetical protein
MVHLLLCLWGKGHTTVRSEHWGLNISQRGRRGRVDNIQRAPLPPTNTRGRCIETPTAAPATNWSRRRGASSRRDSKGLLQLVQKPPTLSLVLVLVLLVVSAPPAGGCSGSRSGSRNAWPSHGVRFPLCTRTTAVAICRLTSQCAKFTHFYGTTST